MDAADLRDLVRASAPADGCLEHVYVQVDQAGFDLVLFMICRSSAGVRAEAEVIGRRALSACSFQTSRWRLSKCDITPAGTVARAALEKMGEVNS